MPGPSAPLSSAPLSSAPVLSAPLKTLASATVASAVAASSTVVEPPAKVKRLRGDELVSEVFDEAHVLPFLTDALEVGRCILSVLQRLLPCEASMVHFFDVERQEFIVACAEGEGGEDMLLKRHPPTDPLLRVVMPTGKAFAWNDLSSAPASSLGRFASLRQVKRALVSPIKLDGRYIGAIELVNPLDDEDFGFFDESAVDYLAGQCAEFVSSHGVIVDVAIIARFAFDRD
jgi:hypothetical protein